MDENNNFTDDSSDRQPEENTSESFGNEQHQDPNPSEGLPKSSEDFRSTSESIPNVSESVRKDSEASPNLSERNTETFGNKKSLSEKTEDHTLSVREVARLFEEAGAPRTERSIINWCNPNKRGIKRLDCYFDEVDRKYFVTSQSVHSIIQEERKKQQFTDFKIQDLSEENNNQFGNVSETNQNSSEELQKGSEDFGSSSESIPNASETVRKDSETVRKEPKSEQQNERRSEYQYTQSNDELHRIKDIENELNDLKITNKAKDYFIDRLQEQAEKERQSYIEERTLFIEQLTLSSKKIGELETKLLQIEAPKREPIDVIGGEVKTNHYVSDESSNISPPQN